MEIPTKYTFDEINDFVHDPNTDFEQMQALCLNMAIHFDKRDKRVPVAGVSRENRLKWLLATVGSMESASEWDIELIKKYSVTFHLPCSFVNDRICCRDLEDDLHALQKSNWLQRATRLHQAQKGVCVERIYMAPAVTL